MSIHGNHASAEALKELGINSPEQYWNLDPATLEEHAIEQGEAIRTSTGAIAINTGEFTGRSPKDRFLVKDEITEGPVWWGDINIPFSSEDFDKLYDKVAAYLSERRVYVRDSYVCADPKYRTNIRTVNELPWSNQFVSNMFMDASDEELVNFQHDWLILNAPGFKADPAVDKTRQHNFAILNFSKRIALVGGTGYTGEMKKGIFSALNFILPHMHNVLPMHCSANIGEAGDTALYFGLSGTGKTTLSADPDRRLIGDDEHGWSPEHKIFNFEGGCYAKCIDLTEEKEPDIFRAIRQGALLENIGYVEGTNIPDYHNSDITENTRVSYPLDHIDNIAVSSIGTDPKNVFFLTCDANGVLPPISKLTPGQAMFHFISGYTAKVAGTEEGIVDPVSVFSACFGAPFMPMHPTAYAEMLGQKMQEAGTSVWLVNTGWSGGAFGVGERMSLPITRALITAALNGDLDQVEYEEHPIFGLAMPTSCPNVPDEVLNPKNTWADKDAYDRKANDLAAQFNKNFRQFESYANEEIMGGAPKEQLNA